MLSKKITSSIASLLLLASIFLPSLSSAQQQAAKPAVNFCGRVSTLQTTLDQTITDRKNKLENTWTQRQQMIATNRSNREQRLTSDRLQWDQNRQERYNKMMAKATTDSQKQAITAFEATIELAVKTRKSAADGAIQTFRSSLDQAINTRETDIKTAISNFQSAVDNAFSQAKTDCDKGAQTAIVHSNLKTALQAARQQFEITRQTADKVSTQEQTLAQARRNSVEQAISTFKTTLQDAITTLKTALGKN